MWMSMMALAAAADLEGTWVLDSPASELQTALEASADESVSRLPAAFRSRAKGKLLSKAGFCETYEVVVEEAQVAWTCDDREPFLVRRDQLGTAFEIRRDGRRVEVLVTLEERRLLATFEASGGRRTLELARDGESMTSTSTLANEKLSSPLTWSARYERAEAAQ